MSEINFNSVFDGVSLALHQAFPESQIHGGEVEQGLMPGDFNVILTSAGIDREVGGRWRRSPLVDVLYYPKEGEAELYTIAHRLVEVLDSIVTPQGDILHARAMNWEVIDRVLHFLLRYDYFTYTLQESEKMETLTIR